LSETASDVLEAPPQAEDQGPAGAPQGKTPWQLFWDRFRKDKLAFVGLAVIVVLAAAALFAPLIARRVGHGPNDISHQFDMTDEFGLPRGPSIDKKFYFGADKLGRDVFVRTIYGIRSSFIVALTSTAAAVFVGVLLGITAGYFGGWIDTVISRAVDIVLSIPVLLFALGIAGACSATKEGCLGGIVQPGITLVVFVIAIFSWPTITRIVRGNTLSLREREFVEASRSLGATNARIMMQEILPNLVAPILVYSTLIIPSNIIFEASLSFLGLGIPQNTPSLGRILNDAADLFDAGAWWLMLFPGAVLVLATLAFNLLGDGLRDALDPRTSST
jgi:peptide/nickel transport system permease protein